VNFRTLRFSIVRNFKETDPRFSFRSLDAREMLSNHRAVEDKKFSSLTKPNTLGRAIFIGP
jgi:hypothetical protein